MSFSFSLEEFVVGCIIVLIIILLTLFILVVLGNMKKVRTSVKETSESTKSTTNKIDHLDKQLKRLNEDNKEIIKVHRQIKDKSEAMNKMLEQTNKIYNEVLDKKNEVETTDKGFLKIDYEKINKPQNQEAGDHLTQIINNINSDKKQITEKLDGMNLTDRNDKKHSKSSMDQLTKIDVENIKRMNMNELDELFLTLKDYKIILNKELDYYVDQIDQINKNKTVYSADQRLKRKEFIYDGIKEVEDKIDYQKVLINEVKKRKQHLELEEETSEKEKELDELINNMVKKR